MPKEKYSQAAEILEHSQAIGRALRPLPQRLLPDRGHRACAGTTPTAAGSSPPTAATRMRARFVVHGERPAAPAEAARHPGHRRRSRATRSTPAAGTTTTPAATPSGGLDRLRRQARRHHRHRRDGGAVRAAPRRGGEAAVRVPAHAVVDRRARQPADRPRVGREPRARLAAAADGELQQPRVGGIPEAEDLVDDGWTDIIGNLLIRAPARRGRHVAGGVWRRRWSWPTSRRWSRSARGSTTIVKDPNTAEALKPCYRQFCKRPCFHDEYLDTFNRPNVHLIDTEGRGVERITDDGRRRRTAVGVRGRLPDLRHRLRGRHRLHAPRRLRGVRPRRPHAHREVGTTARRRCTACTAAASRTASSSASPSRASP